MTKQWDKMPPDKFSERPRAVQTAMALSTETGIAVSKQADPLGTLDLLALLEETDREER